MLSDSDFSIDEGVQMCFYMMQSMVQLRNFSLDTNMARLFLLVMNGDLHFVLYPLHRHADGTMSKGPW